MSHLGGNLKFTFNGDLRERVAWQTSDSFLSCFYKGGNRSGAQSHYARTLRIQEQPSGTRESCRSTSVARSRGTTDRTKKRKNKKREKKGEKFLGVEHYIALFRERVTTGIPSREEAYSH